MLMSRWLLSFLAMFILWLQKFSLSECLLGLNMLLSCLFGSVFIIPMSLSDIGSFRGLLPFSGVMLSVFCCVSRSFHFRKHSSPIRMAVSLRV